MGSNGEELGLRKRLEALKQERELCEGKKVELFRAVNKLKQELREGLIDEQRFNEELARLPKAPPQIITDCNEEIKSIEAEADAVRKQLDRLVDKKRKERITAAAVVAVVVLLSVSALFLTSKLTGFVTREEVNVYTQQIGANFTQPQQYVLNISAANVTGELRSLELSGRLIGNGTVKVYLQKGNTRLLVLDTEALQNRGASGVIAVTGMAIADLSGKAAVLEENATPGANESEADITPQLPEELNLTLNETQMNRTQANGTTVNETVVNETQPAPEAPLPEAPAAVEKAINISLAYKSGTVFDSNDDGVELDTSAIDFTVEGTNFSWPADSSKLCTRWVATSLDNNTQGAVCYGSAECCGLLELAPAQAGWNDAFELFVGRYGASYNNTVSSQVIFANYSLEPGNVYSEIYYSSFSTLPATFVKPQQIEENLTENITLTNVTVIEFNNVCIETCSLAGIAGLNLSKYVLAVEVDNATLVLDSATYTLAKVVELDTEAPVVAILLPRNITYTDTLSANESRNTTPLKLNFTVSEPASWVGYSINGQGNITITSNTTITAANGTNTLLLYATDQAGNTGYAVAQFFVNITAQPLIDTEPPIITALSPLPNATYNTTAVELNFTTSEPATVSYFLNLQNRTEISANATLAAEEGRNRLLLLATDAAGNAGYESIIFFVNTSNTTAANITVNITPMLKAKKPHFQLDEDAELEFEYIGKSELVKAGKWNEGYEAYEDDYEEYLEAVSTVKKAAVEQAAATEKAKVKRKQHGQWITENETITATVAIPEYGVQPVDIEIEELREGKFRLHVHKQRAFRPGLYKATIEFVMGNESYSLAQDFAWGVLAINTNKSIYLPNENAFIAMAVLDDRGHMVCDANVSLAITDPAGATTAMNTSSGKISISPECRLYGITNLPDYYTTYTVGEVGTYIMDLTAVTANGIRIITDNFTVQSQVDFDVARFGPTRIYPPVPYNMSFAITANRNYNGLIVEFVPASFNIAPQQGLTVTTVASAGAKALSWSVSLKKGETARLHYQFDAPDVSPYLYTVGRLQLSTFTESRDWMVASDVLAAGEKEATKLTAQECLAMVNTATANTYTSACSGTYPSNCGGAGGTDYVSCYDSTQEPISRARNKYGGVNITAFNSTITNCDTISSVRICHRWPPTTGDTQANCMGSVDIARGASWSNFWTTCPSPSSLTCTDVSSLESWNCGVFFGSSPTKANARVEDQKTNTGSATNLIVETLYFNVTYTETAVDTTPPNNSIILPLQNANFSGSFLVNASVNDTTGVARVNLTVYNNTGNATGLILMSLGAGTATAGWWNVTFDSTTMGDARYNLSVNATDSAATPNTNISLNVSITIDNTEPNVSIVVPLNLTNTSSTALLINASVNDSLTGVFNATFRLTTSTGSTLTAWLYSTNNTPRTLTQSYWNTTFDTSTVADGTYNITINATDYANSQQIINISTINIDRTKPNATITSPTNFTNISTLLQITVSVNDSPSRVFNVSFRLANYTNNSATSWFNGTLSAGTIDQGTWNSALATANVPEGTYNITVNATDFSGNQQLLNLSTINIDNTKPNGTIIAPANNTVINGSFIINASVNDSLSKVFNVTFRLRRPGSDSSAINSTLATGNIDQGYWSSTVNSSTFANGIYNITLNASDFAGNVLFINSSTVTINNTGLLNITLNGPLNLSVNVGQNRTFTANATISCRNGLCQQVNATVYYNLTSLSPSKELNASAGHVPFHNITTFVNQTCSWMDIDAVCSLNWTINATGAIGSSYYLSINFTSNNSEIQQNGTRNFQVNITEPVAANTAPVVWNVTNGTVTLVDGGATEFVVSFNATDEQGSSDLNSATAAVNITLNGLQRYNDSGKCTSTNGDANTKMYSCKVVFYYYDNASSLWTINASIQDASAALGWNDTYSSGRRDNGASNNLTVNSLSAFSMVSSSIAATTSTNTQNVEMTFTINNTGNFDFTLVNLTPTDLNASLTDIFRLEGNFSINATQSTGIGFGTGILNGTPTNFSESNYPNSATLPHKATPDQAGQTAESDNKANRTLYIYIDIPQNKGLSTGVTYNVSPSRPWQVILSTPS